MSRRKVIESSCAVYEGEEPRTVSTFFESAAITSIQAKVETERFVVGTVVADSAPFDNDLGIR